METKANLAKAIIKVMQEVKGIDKSMTVGTGAGSYKGVPDQEVKKIIGEAMAKNGLSMLPFDVSAKTEVSRWEETYNGQTKQKQSVFTEVHTKYLLIHESGESQVISGYGHGVDSQDKGAGKATTYALKYALLYTFLVPTGKIDDADTTHSDNHETPKQKINTIPIVEMLSEEKFGIAMQANKKGILATLKAYNGQNGKGMSASQLENLTKQLSIAPEK